VPRNPKNRSIPQLNLTYDEAAFTLGVSKSTVMRMIAAGEITAIPMGPQIRRVPMSEIEEYLARKVEAEKAARAGGAELAVEQGAA
jgi:excisionase family DNA binding protein